MGTLIVFGVFILASFILGAMVGSKKTETITNPITVLKEKKIEKIEQKEKDREKVIEEINLANIDAYDGTSLGQQDFPR